MSKSKKLEAKIGALASQSKSLLKTLDFDSPLHSVLISTITLTVVIDHTGKHEYILRAQTRSKDQDWRERGKGPGDLS
jgi:hypothetical protein